MFDKVFTIMLFFDFTLAIQHLRRYTLQVLTARGGHW